MTLLDFPYSVLGDYGVQVDYHPANTYQSQPEGRIELTIETDDSLYAPWLTAQQARQIAAALIAAAELKEQAK